MMSDIIEIDGCKYMPLRLADPNRYRVLTQSYRMIRIAEQEKQLADEYKLILAKKSKLRRKKRDNVIHNFNLLFAKLGNLKIQE